MLRRPQCPTRGSSKDSGRPAAAFVLVKLALYLQLGSRTAMLGEFSRKYV